MTRALRQQYLILIWPRPLSFRDALWPPVEERRRADQVRTGLERDTAFGLDVFEDIDRGEMAVGEHGVGERPEMLRRLELRRVGGQKQQVDVVRDAQMDTAMPARPVEHQHDLFARPRPDRTRELGEFDFEKRNVDRRSEVENGAP